MKRSIWDEFLAAYNCTAANDLSHKHSILPTRSLPLAADTLAAKLGRTFRKLGYALPASVTLDEDGVLCVLTHGGREVGVFIVGRQWVLIDPDGRTLGLEDLADDCMCGPSTTSRAGAPAPHSIRMQCGHKAIAL